MATRRPVRLKRKKDEELKGVTPDIKSVAKSITSAAAKMQTPKPAPAKNVSGDLNAAPPTKLKKTTPTPPKPPAPKPVPKTPSPARSVSSNVSAPGKLPPGVASRSPQAVRKRLKLASDPEKAVREGSTVPGWNMKRGTAPEQASMNPIDLLKTTGKVGAAVVGTPLRVSAIPLNAGAGAAHALIKGKGVKGARKEVDKALQLKGTATVGTLLHDVGVPRGPANVAGFVGDTLVNRGLPSSAVGSTGKRIATKVGQQSARKGGTATSAHALESTFTAPQLKRIGAQAAGKKAEQKAYEKTVKQAEKAGKSATDPTVLRQATAAGKTAKREKRHSVATGGTGLKVSSFGKEIPGVQSFTGAAFQPLQRLKRRAKESKLGTGVQGAVGQVSPNKPPPGMSQAEWDRVTMASRSARGTASKQSSDARMFTNAARRGQDPESVKTAAGRVAAQRVRQTQKGYEARLVNEQGRTIKPTFDKATGTHSYKVPVPHDYKPPKFASEKERAAFVARHGENPARLRRGEKLYLPNERSGGFREISPDELSTLSPKAGRKVVALHRDIPKTARQSVNPTLERGPAGEFADKATGGYKGIQYGNLAFHLRQIPGDVQLGSLAMAGHKTPFYAGRSGRQLTAVGKREEKILAAKTPQERIKAATRGAQSKRGREGLEAVERGAVRSGFLNRDVGQETLRTTGSTAARTTARGVKGRLGRGFKRMVANREDLFRGGTYARERKKGVSPEHAAKQTSKYHFDYGHMTDTERKVLRRIYPYYTFPARNIPHQIRQYVKNPRKYANFEAARQEALQSAGLNRNDMTNRQDQAASFPIPTGKGKAVAVDFGSPVQDLQKASPRKLQGRVVTSLNPAIGALFDTVYNQEAFTGKKINDVRYPLQKGPEYLKALPSGLKKRLGIVEDYIDPRTQKKTVGVPGPLNYALKKLSFGVAGSAMRAGTLPSQGGSKLTRAGTFLGFPSTPINKTSGVSNELDTYYKRSQDISRQLAALRQRGKSQTEEPNIHTYRLGREKKALEEKIKKLNVKRGDKGVRLPKSEIEKTKQRLKKIEFESRYPEVAIDEARDRLKKIEEELRAR